MMIPCGEACPSSAAISSGVSRACRDEPNSRAVSSRICAQVLRFTNSVRSVPLLRYLGYPGLWLQLLTTKEPTDDQVEVAIASFERMLEADRRNGLKAVDSNSAVGA